ncbi:MAG: CehA/McbA family metallohydrolase [Desulfobacteraceae bacterium]|jgi:hypothetical protein
MAHFEYIGNLHIHSLYSDGGGSISQIARSAANANLDFVCLNDHDYLTNSLHLEEEGFYGDVLVLIGLEIGGRYHHYLAYDLKKLIKGHGLGPQEVIDHVNEQGGFGFLAHPFEKGMPFSEKSKAYTWNHLSVEGYTGICIWNYTSRWKERVKSVLHGLFLLTFKSLSLRPPSQKTLAFWDDLCRHRRVVAVGGSDAHGSIFRYAFINFRPLSYEHLLRTVSIHILLENKMSKDFEQAKEEVYGAMREGRLFIAHEKICSAKGFRFSFHSDAGLGLAMGDESHFQPGDFVVSLPHDGEIRLFKDGKLEKKWRSREAAYRAQERGVYRTEVYRYVFPFGWRPWIFSNPIYLR